MERKEVAKNIILGIGVVGVISVVMIAPGLAKTLPYLSKIDFAQINQALKRLQKRGLVEIIKRQNGISEIKLTFKGKELAETYKMDTLKIERPKKWDGKWRIIIFDIPLTKNPLRAKFRRKIKELGFYRLQNSVFVYPYPCFEVVEYIRKYFGIRAEVEYIEAENLESQNDLIKHFFT